MTLALIALTVLAVVVFGFVLEPVLRARSDQTVLDAAALPDHDAVPLDDDLNEVITPGDGSPTQTSDADGLHSSRRVPIDRPASSDAS